MPPPSPIILKLQHKLLPISHVFNLGLHCPVVGRQRRKVKIHLMIIQVNGLKKNKDFFNKNLQMDLREKDTSAKKRRNKEEIQRWRREECERQSQ